MTIHKGMTEIVRDMQRIKEATLFRNDILDMRKTMDAAMLPKIASDHFALTGAIKLKSLLDDSVKWKLPDMGVSKEQLFWKAELAERNFFKNQFTNHELLRGVTLSQLGKHALDMSLPKLFHIDYKLPKLYDGIENILGLKESIFTTLKTSRIFNEHFINKQNFYKVEYDLSKIAEPNDTEASQIITPSLLITEAKTIKKVIQDIYKNNANLFKIRPREFEELVAELLNKKGYAVELTKQTRDGGYDIIALRFDNGMPLKYLVECKKYGKNRPVGIDIVRSFCDVIRSEDANKGIIFTTSSFTSGVRARQKSNPFILELKDHSDIIQWVENYMLNF